MKPLNENGFVYYTENDIYYREYLINTISTQLRYELENINQAFNMIRCETSLLINKNFVDNEYFDEKDYIYSFGDMCLRPETTKGSYEFAKTIMNPHNAISFKPPICVWQVGKSFRNEQDKTYKNMRLKEFYQLEFQIFYSKNTKSDYPEMLYDKVKNILQKELKKELILEESDRLPKYSTKTIDVVSKDNNMELCSMSSRIDFDEDIKVFEVAIGIDRMLYNKE